jgi:sugar phosphate permease
MKYQHRVVGMLSLLSIVTYIDRVSLAVAGPRIQESLHITPEQWGWVTSAFFLSYSLFEIPSGALADRIGPRRVLTRIVLWWSAFTSLTGMVSSYALLLLVRFCFGMGEAGAYPSASAVIARWIPARHRARTWGLIWMTAQIGAAVTPLIVVPIQVRFGWQASFYTFGVLGVAWSAVWYAWFRDSPSEKRGVSPQELIDIGSGSPSGHDAMPWKRALRSAVFWQIAAVGACYVYSLAFFQSWLQTYLVKGRGFTEAALMLSSLPYIVGGCANALGGFASDALVRRIGLRHGRRTIGALGLLFAATFMLAAVRANSGGWALAFLSLAYAGILFQQPNLCAVCLDTGKAHAGAVFGFMNTAANLASSVAALAFGYLVAYTGSYNAPFIPMLTLLCLGAVLWLKLDPSHEIFQEHAAAEPMAPPVESAIQAGASQT